MAVRGMLSSTYSSMQPQYDFQVNSDNREFDPTFKVIYNQCFYGPLEQNIDGCETELRFYCDKADKSKIMVFFWISAGQFSIPLRKIDSISYSDKGIALHLRDHSSCAKQMDTHLNAKKDIENMLRHAKAPQATDYAKRQLIFLVDQSQNSLERSFYKTQFQMISRFVPPSKNKRQPHTSIGHSFIDFLDDIKWTEFLQMMFLGPHANDPSTIVYQYDVVRNHSLASVSYKQIKDECSRPSLSGGKRSHNGLPVPDYSSKSNSASFSPADHSRLQQNGGRPVGIINRGAYNLMEDPSTISLHPVISGMGNLSHQPSGQELEEPTVSSSQTKVIVEALAPDTAKVEKAPTPPKVENTAIELIDDDDEMNGSSSLGGETKPKKNSILTPETELARFTPAGGKNKDSISVSLEDARVLAFNEMLNDSIIEFYLKYSVERCTDDKSLASRVHIFNSFFFQKITENMKQDCGHKSPRSTAKRFGCVASNYAKVRNWTRRIDIFSKDFVVVPINTDIHWFCVVIINPRAAISDEALTEQQIEAARISNSPMKTARPAHIILLDSMPEPTDWKRSATIDIILDYLEKELMDKKKSQLHRQNIGKLYLRNVPKQSNMIDCGLYLLAFIEAIFRKPPTIEMLNKPRVDFRDLYPDFEITPLDHMRDKVTAVLKSCAGTEKWSNLVEFEKNKGNGVTIATTDALIDRARRPRRYSDSSFPFVEKAPGFLARCHSEPPAFDRIPASMVLRRE